MLIRSRTLWAFPVVCARLDQGHIEWPKLLADSPETIAVGSVAAEEHARIIVASAV
jgi:hypothetical protein